jgi:hypothetical protein
LIHKGNLLSRKFGKDEEESMSYVSDTVRGKAGSGMEFHLPRKSLDVGFDLIHWAFVGSAM